MQQFDYQRENNMEVTIVSPVDFDEGEG